MNMRRPQIFLLTVTAAALGAQNAAAAGEIDVTHQRQVYNEVNKSAGDMQKVRATLSGDGGPVALTGWLDDGEARKITASPGLSGAGSDEIYLENGQPVFVFSVLKKNSGTIKDRVYLENGEIVKWISTDPSFVAHGEDYASMAGRLAAEVPRYIGALAGGEEDGGRESAEGTFTGIEQGDYAHFKLRAGDGTERSFFILQTDAALDRILADPQEYEGRACRVRWERRSENIPEAGGPMEIDVLLGVTWQ
jgi:hypothetical protein